MVLGVIGGLGPKATAYFMELVIDMTDAQNDQDHLEMIIYNYPKIPDRTKYILGQSTNNPVIPMVQIGQRLMAQGVDCIAVPCITAHYFYDNLVKQVDLPIINALEETALHLKENGIKAAGIMATTGTVVSGIFQDRLSSLDIRCVLPSTGTQSDIMDIIYNDIKAGQTPDIRRFRNIADKLREKGAEVVILGCTELSLIKRDFDIGTGYIDVMEVLAKASVVQCQCPLKGKYECLITGKGGNNAIQHIGIS
ncbi:MAG: amino acid racemase [Clostridiales bacterium]|nr:amino acid racemase [Clostridiales bacterium]